MGNEQDLLSQAKEALREHITVNDWYLDRHIQEFVENMKLISETKIENDEDLQVLKGKLHEPDDFTTELFMDQLLNNHENAKESLPAFEKAFITLDNSMVQLYFTTDEDIFNGVVVAAKRKHDPHSLCLVFVVD